MGDSCRPKGSIPVQSSQSSGSEEEGPGLDEQKRKYISREMLPYLIGHVKANMGFTDDEVLHTPSGFLLHQFQSSAPIDVPVHLYILEVLKHEWKDPDKIMLPQFMAKLYPVRDMQKYLPVSASFDSFVASQVGITSLVEDAMIKNAVEKVAASLRKVYSGSDLAIQADLLWYCGTGHPWRGVP
ncbi:hypothetical protein NDU88_002792 [Pleurodeles waltl]|uniref:Uncharacterized protein n=1 Tax=Pleurodeles waltl TaxID=8319 RepID=A0AAV7NIX0_PLEWA|nr:hypothetical protein NDU88_002792 [Pleurodeles waltl]